MLKFVYVLMGHMVYCMNKLLTYLIQMAFWTDLTVIVKTDLKLLLLEDDLSRGFKNRCKHMSSMRFLHTNQLPDFLQVKTDQTPPMSRLP